MNKYIVFMKQVPKSTKIEMDPVTKTLIRGSVAARTNPDDLHALVAALDAKRACGGEVIAVSMGPEKATEVLAEALMLGADRALLISDRVFAGSDTLCTSYVLAEAARYIGGYAILFFGRMAIDGDTAQVGPEVAAHLDIPQLTNILSIDHIDNRSITAKRRSHNRIQALEVQLPCVITVSKNMNSIPNPTISEWERAQGIKIERMTAKDLNINPKQVGLDGSPTRVVSTDIPLRNHTITWLSSVQELAARINTHITPR